MNKRLERLYDAVYERAKVDLILIPRGVRIVIDYLLALGIFLSLVAYPIIRSIVSGCHGDVTYIIVFVGASCSWLFVRYADGARRRFL